MKARSVQSYLTLDVQIMSAPSQTTVGVRDAGEGLSVFPPFGLHPLRVHPAPRPVSGAHLNLLAQGRNTEGGDCSLSAGGLQYRA